MTDGTVTRRPHGWELRYQRRLRHPVEAVWSAITDDAHTAAWWGRLDADLRPGGRFVVTWNNSDAVMHAVITRYEPPTLLETRGDIHGVLRWELVPDGDATVLVFTSILEEEPSGEHEGMTIGFPEVLAGWHTHLDRLADHLAGGPARWSEEAWKEARDRYRDVVVSAG